MIQHRDEESIYVSDEIYQDGSLSHVITAGCTLIIFGIPLLLIALISDIQNTRDFPQKYGNAQRGINSYIN